MRNQNVDVIRGFALLGLTFMNIYYFGLFEYGYVESATPPLSDHVIHVINLIFFDGRFRSLFCLIFGASLYIQWQRYQTSTALIMRLKVLAVIGLLHGFLIWAGDILFIYACSGWLTCKYLQHNTEHILTRAWQFMLVGMFMSFLLALIEPSINVNRQSAEFLASYQDTYASTLSIVSRNLIMFVYMIIAIPLITLWSSSALMLIGIYSYKKGVFNNGLQRQAVTLISIAALVLTLIRISLDYMYSATALALKEPVNWLAALSFALIFIHIIAVKSSKTHFLYRGFEHLGRLSLSLYIMQSVVLFSLFKVCYPRWVLTFDRLDYLLLAAIFAILQYGLCQYYSRYFTVGPLEYLWRRFSH